LRQVLERGPDALVVLDRELRCRWANALARAALAPAGGGLVGESVCDLVPALTGTPVDRAFHAAIADRRIHTIARVRAPSGRWFEVHALPIDVGILAHFRDVTETVVAERALREQERRYRRLVEHASDVVLVLDADGVVRYVSPAAARVVGRPPGELEGRSWFDLAHPDDRSALEQAFRHTLDAPAGSTVSARARIQAGGGGGANGRWVTIEALGARVAPEPPPAPPETGDSSGPIIRESGIAEWPGVVDLRPPEARREADGEGPDAGASPMAVITVRDVTEQAAAEAALRASEASYRVLLEQLADGIAVVETAGDGHLTMVNDRLSEMTGFTREELLAMRVPDLVIDAEFGKDERMERLARGETLLTRWKLRRKDGPPITAEISTRMIGTRIQAVIRDLTERELFEEHRRAVQKLEALGLLAGSVAHDFNNFLLAIQSNVELALGEVDGVAAAPAIRAELEDIRRVAQRAARLTRQLLTFSRKQTPQPSTFPLGEAVTGIEQLLRRLVEPSVRLAVHAPKGSGAGVVSADLGQLEQVVMNLVVNARDAMGDGGVVDVGVRTESLAAPMRAGLTGVTIPPGDYAVLSVTDGGAGMSRETARRVFEPFFTTKEAGTGLGLWTVHAIVTQAGGHVTVESTPGVGSTFEVWLPAVPAEVAV
jgi:PAS domain S-box-containing protein